MSPKKTDPDSAPPPLIIFDPADGQMHAAAFDKAMAKTARHLAKRYKCHIATGDDAALSDLATRLMPGRIEENRLLLASVPEDVAAELRRLIEPEPEENATTPVDPDENIEAMSDDLRQAEADGLGPLSTDDVISLQSADPVSEGSETANAPLAGDVPADPWDKLAVGNLVLAADLDKRGEPESWYEAVIVRITPASFILRFRDYPKDGLLARTRKHVALLHPTP